MTLARSISSLTSSPSTVSRNGGTETIRLQGTASQSVEFKPGTLFLQGPQVGALSSQSLSARASWILDPILVDIQTGLPAGSRSASVMSDEPNGGNPSTLATFAVVATPTVTSVTSAPVNAILGTDETVTFTLNFSQTLTMAGGIPTLLLNDGGTATDTTGSDTSALTLYCIESTGQNTADLTITGSRLNGAAIQHGAGTSAYPTGAAVNPVGFLQIDTATPTPPSTPDLLTAMDSGLSHTDNITNIASPTFSGTGENGATVALFDGSVAIGTATVTGGTWSVIPTTALTEG